MAKLTSEAIKKVIAATVQADPMTVVAPFEFKTVQEAYNNGMKNQIHAAFDPKSWKRESKEKITERFDPNARGARANWGFVPFKGYERMFDCRPFDSQIRAYVISDEKDEIIVEIRIVGE